MNNVLQNLLKLFGLQQFTDIPPALVDKVQLLCPSPASGLFVFYD